MYTLYMYTLVSNSWEFQLLHIFVNAYIVILFNFSYLAQIEWYLTEVLLCISLIANDDENQW